MFVSVKLFLILPNQHKTKGMVEMRRMLQEKRWYDILEAEEVVKRILVMDAVRNLIGKWGEGIGA